MVMYQFGCGDVRTLPRVNTPSVVDLPLSTFPTTAHLTSGVRDTLAGGNRNKIEARGCPVDSVNSTHACCGHQCSASIWIEEKLTFPPISSTVLVNLEHRVLTSSAVRASPVQLAGSSVISPEKSSAREGCFPTLSTYSPLVWVSSAANRSRAVSWSASSSERRTDYRRSVMRDSSK